MFTPLPPSSKELWDWVFGAIDTREKFLDKRLELAAREWRYLKANDSLECRSCHDFRYMDFTRQGKRAEEAHAIGWQAGGDDDLRS